ncbi:stAR-related lipid transfer protein 7, mitochondrial-like [Lycorma delicatula]|uniref:stAR-related lipid transfer protein 7, mitochondrial-like n=1 Tax=Lycorma delicatula TaxID=130591 RepID=UPI003F519205
MQLLCYTRFLFQNSSYLQPRRSTSLQCKQFVTIIENRMYSSWIRNFNRNWSHSHFNNDIPRHRIFSVSYAYILMYSFKAALERVPIILRGHSMNIVKHCVEQCEFIIAHRVRRSQQIVSLYSKLWDEMALKQFINKLRRKLAKGGRFTLLAAGMAFNWDEERISDETIFRHRNEMEVIKELKRKKYCTQSASGKCDCFNCLSPGELEWNVYVSEENLIVWKKEEHHHIGERLYCYKMYARYDDVTALDFLEAQVDLEYRLTWDDHAVKLYSIDSEKSSHSDVIYWETKWPNFFSNRDYVFKRRYHIDRKNKLVTLVNESTTHPGGPVYPNKERVTEYWSYMVIKPYDDLDKPGIEFSLTYFDNPGITMPSTLSSWVTVTGMPAFLQRLHKAAKNLNENKKGSSILDEEKPSGGSRGKPPGSSSDESQPPKEPKNTCPYLPKAYFKRLSDSFFFF